MSKEKYFEKLEQILMKQDFRKYNFEEKNILLI